MSRTLVHKRIDGGNIRSAFNSDVNLAKREIVIGKIGDYYSLYVYDEVFDRAIPIATTSGLTSDDIMTLLVNNYYTINDLYNKSEIDEIVNTINNSIINSCNALVIEINELETYVNSKSDEIYTYIDSSITIVSREKDSLINSAIEEVNGKIYELSASTANFSDHQLLTEQAYYVLSETGRVMINEDGQIDNVNGHMIYYSDKVYYCIYEDDGGGDDYYDYDTITEPDSEGIILINNSTISEDGYIILNGVEITSDGYIINSNQSPSGDSDYNPEIVNGNIELDNIGVEDIENGFLMLSNTILDEENNILIIN